MPHLTRRDVLGGAALLGTASVLAGCVSTAPSGKPGAKPPAPLAFSGDPSALYGPVSGEPHPVHPINLSTIDRAYLRSTVNYSTKEKPGTIVIDPQARYLYLVQENGTAIRYGVGVGREGFGWSGRATINSKQEWPDWYPPPEMIARQPEIKAKMSKLQSGIGMKGGPGNPLGARAMYLWQNNKDTLYRIHGTLEPETIGKRVSSGCIRMINQDAIDLYSRVPVGTPVVVLGAGTV